MKATLSLLAVVLCALSVSAENYKIIYTFNGPKTGDGSWPFGALLTDKSGNLYGTTQEGGATNAAGCDSGCGTIFELSPNSDGTWSESVLYSFCSSGNCSDGAYPIGGLIADPAGNLYGTASVGGNLTCPLQTYSPNGCGVVFQLSPPAVPGGAWTESTTYIFCASPVGKECPDGAFPQDQLALDASGNLYGTAIEGGTTTGTRNGGTVFELSPGSKSWTYTLLHSFCMGGGEGCPDGAAPYAGVTLDALGNLYGTTLYGGTSTDSGFGTIYKLTPGSGVWTESVLFNFHPVASVGSRPYGNVVFDPAGNMYVTGFSGGKFASGTIVRLNAAGKPLGEFEFRSASSAYPTSSVLIDAKNSVAYGTTYDGGPSAVGSVYKVSASGEETVIHNFGDPPDGYQPAAGLVSDQSGNLFGTTTSGGSKSLNGVIFEITP